MKRILIALLVLSSLVSSSQTIGLQKMVQVNDTIAGDFITFESMQTERHKELKTIPIVSGSDTTFTSFTMDSILYKIDFRLFKTYDYFHLEMPSLQWRREIQVLRSVKDKPTNLNEFIYDSAIERDSLLFDCLRIKF